jgi:hypothetical protein
MRFIWHSFLTVSVQLVHIGVNFWTVVLRTRESLGSGCPNSHEFGYPRTSERLLKLFKLKPIFPLLYLNLLLNVGDIIIGLRLQRHQG